jgi:ferric-dicitrate binding protein FerR (iron transport regulator)
MGETALFVVDFAERRNVRLGKGEMYAETTHDAAYSVLFYRRTLRVTERRQDRPTITLDPNAASVHPMVTSR